MIVSVIDSMKYGRRNLGSFTHEEFEQILNTPPPDREKMREESRLFLQRALEARERRRAREREGSVSSE